MHPGRPEPHGFPALPGGLLRNLWRGATFPASAFRRRAAEAPALGASLGTLLLLRSPLAFLSAALGYWGLSRTWTELLRPEGRMAEWLRAQAQMDPEAWRSFWASLPRLPEPGRALPWMVLLAPLGVLSLWLHDAVWDHGCLWMLGGVKRHAFRATLVAEAEALSVGSLGAAAGLLGYLPHLGWVLALPLGAVAVWFWILRGFALAAWHDCPPWKGVAATLLHALLAGCCLGALLGCCVALLALALP